MKPSVVMILGLLATSVAVQAQGPPPQAQQDPAQAPTPRLANGKPDLSGSWQNAGGGLQGSGGNMFRRCTPFQIDAVHGVDQSERGLGVHVGHPAR